MRKFVMVVDSTADLPLELRTKFDIKYCQMNINYEGKEYKASLDWEEYSPKELYDWMRSGKVIKTTQVPFQTFYEVFKGLLEKELDFIYLSCSSALSGSINTAISVVNELKEEFPDAKMYCVDSLISSLGQGFMAIDASQKRDNGASIEEVVAWLEENKLTYNQIATVASLDYLKRAGRVKTSKAFFGNLFNVKPLIISDVVGQNYAFKKARGRAASLKELVKYVKENIVNPEAQVVGISHADAFEEALMIKREIEKEINVKGVYISYIGPIVGSSVGPGTIGVYFVGPKVTIKGE